MDGFKNQSCIITIEEDTLETSIMYSKIMNVVLTFICVGLLVTVIMLLNPAGNYQRILSRLEKIQLLKVVNHQKPLKCAFRSWESFEYPFLPQNTSHSWKVKTSNKLEKPRYAIIGFQTDRKNSAFSNGTMDNGTNIESTEGGLMKTKWKAIKPIISPDTAASEISVANATTFRINHNNNNHNNNIHNNNIHNNMSNINYNTNYYNSCNHHKQ